MRLSVLVPTYRRPLDLNRCLTALADQVRPADQIVIVVREGDQDTFDVAAQWQGRLPVETVTVTLPGTVEAVQRGLDRVSTDVVSITDDDSVPHSEWLRKIEEHFTGDPRLGGLGGRDIVVSEGVAIPSRSVPVGVISWYGRMFGNHHVGSGPAREVEILKGVNMSFRTAALRNLRLDRDIRGKGAPAFEPTLSLAVRNAGWRLLYDPSVTVDHLIAPRPSFDLRQRPSREALDDKSFNYYLTLRRYVKPAWKRAAALFWARIIGTSWAPGIVRGLMDFLRGRGAGEWRAACRMWKQAKQVVAGASHS